MLLKWKSSISDFARDNRPWMKIKMANIFHAGSPMTNLITVGLLKSCYELEYSRYCSESNINFISTLYIDTLAFSLIL